MPSPDFFMEVLNLKKTFAIIALVLVAVLCVPSVPVLAAAFDVHIVTLESSTDYQSDSNLNLCQKYIASYTPGGSYNPSVENIYTYLNSYSWASSGDLFIIAMSRYSDSLIIYEFDSANDGDVCFVVQNASLPSDTVGNTNYTLYCVGSRASASWYAGTRYSEFSLRQSDPTWNNQSGLFLGGNVSGNFCVELTQMQILATNCPVYMNYDIVQNGGAAVTSSSSSFYNVDKSSYTNFFSPDIPYVNGDGDIVDPAPHVESNANHMYFQNCDLGFCEPTDIKNFTSFGGAYLYCKYTLDNWVVNHINDYQLQFNVVSAIGSEQNNFTYSMRVDRNGFVTIPFSYLFQSDSSSAIPINRGFAAVVTNQKLGPDYNIAHLYSVANSNVPNFIRTLGAEYNYNLTDLGWSALKGGTLKYLCAWVSDGGTISMNNLAEWSENVAQSFNPYILRVNVKLVSGNDVSGDYAEKFDLYAGDQSTVDTGGLVNNDPFVPDVDQDDGDLPSVPQDPNSTTPSTIVYTGGTFTGNFNGVIGFDPGYRDLKADLDADPDDNFTQYLAPFKNNEVGGFVGDFLDDMPVAMKSIFVGGFGVLTLLGIYRFIRRG